MHKKNSFDEYTNEKDEIISNIKISNDTLEYYYAGIKYYNNLINNLTLHKPFFFSKKKNIEYNNMLKEYNSEIERLNLKIKNEINYIDNSFTDKNNNI